MQVRIKPGSMYAYRTRAGLSRDALARRMKISASTAYRVESGKAEPGPKFIAALLHETGRPFTEFFETVDDEESDVA